MTETTTSLIETSFLASFWENIPFLRNTFLNNSLQDWLIALFIILGAIIVTRTVYWFTEKYVMKLTEKTKTKLDDNRPAWSWSSPSAS